MVKEKKYHSRQITARFLEVLDDRINRGENLSDFSKVVGMSTSNISRLRTSNGKNNVTVELAALIIHAYNVSPLWLMTGRGTKYQDDSVNLWANQIVAGVDVIEHSVSDVWDAIEALKQVTKRVTKCG